MNKTSDHQYADEFMQEASLLEFSEWLFTNLTGFATNLLNRQGKFPKSLHEWITWFLDWTEYSDFMEWKKEGEKDE